MQNLQGKIAGYNYYLALEKLTDNTGMSKIKVSKFAVAIAIQPSYFLTPGLVQRVHAHHA
jgi:hypothetical protein